MENIRLGRRGATDGEVLEAVKAAQCDEFICKLSQGYQTVIGENGSTLSCGPVTDYMHTVRAVLLWPTGAGKAPRLVNQRTVRDFTPL